MSHSRSEASHPASSSASPAGSDWPTRAIAPDELPTFHRVLGEAMLFGDITETRSEAYGGIMEFDRSLCAFDGSQMVGASTTHSLEMTLPGGPRPVAGVSAVGVWPSHRRRGVLSAIMRRQLADTRERGENVAALFASEGAIYGRFGYGPASRAYAVTVRTHEVDLRPDIPRDPALRLRLSTPGAAGKELATVHRTAAAQRVGEFQRDERWWKAILADEPERRGGASAYRCAIAEDDAGPLGYVVYRITGQWTDHGTPDGRIDVAELVATAPAAYALLWEYLLTRDLVTTVSAELVAPDDPLLHLVTDPQRIHRQVTNGLWIRLVDVAAALEQRSYAAPVDVVLEVSDASAPWNAGRWRLTADTEAARCTGTDAEPDIRLDVCWLGAAYLGGTTLGTYRTAGLITEETPGAVDRLDTALSRSEQPFCGEIF
ncbi:GNAT family N-acetyltransferase [Nocardiopsis gilva YIM 90087]|uniref:GNAT family N-acetyltransferase n=1 Tax=Nocardiopsis gilva YIM 90087 TaxID=1235441 RepID=A0A223S9S4_9ACTN|nr:GNAT family N-acetyltransferase [Nocardiopsis gilva]ASU84842.1 GNAT family N-acetyltransferase [Nocardiopsis gilva YIM 90087]